jgi:hypothetical protein
MNTVPNTSPGTMLVFAAIGAQEWDQNAYTQQSKF